MMVWAKAQRLRGMALSFAVADAMKLKVHEGIVPQAAGYWVAMGGDKYLRLEHFADLVELTKYTKYKIRRYPRHWEAAEFLVGKNCWRRACGASEIEAAMRLFTSSSREYVVVPKELLK